MRYFVLLLDLDGAPITDSAMQAYESLPIRRGLTFRWLRAGAGMLLDCGDELRDGTPIASHGKWTVVGDVRLDNRETVAQWAGCPRERCGDLSLLAQLFACHGIGYADQLIGDFAFIAWNAASRSGFAVRDAMGIRRLYHARAGRVMVFSSRAEALDRSGKYNHRYLAEHVAGCEHSPADTPYDDVSAIPAATIARITRDGITLSEYWSAYDFVDARATERDERSLAEECRDLLATSVRLRVAGNGAATWAQLSGGLDSSSIVSIARWMAERGDTRHPLAGTVTYVDHHGAGADERTYSDAVVKRFGIRNELVVDKGMWHDDGDGPPLTDFPSSVYPLYARERELCRIVRASGGRVLLTGNGGDQLFAGNMFFFADWVVSGHPHRAVREMLHRAAIGRVSFWELAYRNAILPILPAVVRRQLVHVAGRLPGWISPLADRRYRLRDRAPSVASYAGRRGSKYGDAVAASTAATPGVLYLGVLDDSLTLRHPLLYRPLVEFALRLPPELCARPHRRKWILREAMRGILPDIVLSRIGKSTLAGPFSWSLVNQRTLLEPLVADPILAQLGIVEPSLLRAALIAARSAPGRGEQFGGAVHHTLGLEAWLRVRSGRWPDTARKASRKTTFQSALT